jgi:hypothetical protein
LSEAWEVLQDSSARRAYDIRYLQIKRDNDTRHEATRKQETVAKAARDKAAREATEKAASDKIQQDLLAGWLKWHKCQGDLIFEARRTVRQLEAELKGIREIDVAEAAKSAKENSWSSYFSSFISQKSQLPEAVKEQEESKRLQRLARKRIKEDHLGRSKVKLKDLEDELVRKRVAHIEVLRQQELKAWRAHQEAREQQEREEKARERERSARNAEDLRAKMNAEHEQAKWPKGEFSSQSQQSKRSSCRHRRFWTRVSGRYTCRTCHQLQYRFVFKCPGCDILACASCRDSLKQGRDI